MDPPYFSPQADLQIWRKEVARWVDKIKASAEKGSDRLYKTVFATLGRHLYDTGLPSSQQSIVDEAQARGKIDYKQDDPIQAVKDIVDLVASDPPIAVVSRLICSFNRVTECTRDIGRGESLSSFVSRFHGLASEHLMISNATASSQVGEVLAITLLNNARLPDSTLTNAKLELISRGEVRARSEAENATKLANAEALASIENALISFQDMEKGVSIRRASSEVNKYRAAFHALHRNVCKSTGEFSAAFSDLSKNLENEVDIKDPEAIKNANKKPCKLDLRDAVEVLGNLTIASGPSTGIDKKQVDRIVTKNVQKALLAFKNQMDTQKNHKSGSKSVDGNKGKKRRNYESRDECNPKNGR